MPDQSYLDSVNTALDRFHVGGSGEMEQRRRLLDVAMGRNPEDYASADFDTPGVRGLIEQTRPESMLDGANTNTFGELEAKLAPWFSVGGNADLFTSNDYRQQRLGANARADIPVGAATLSPHVEVGATRVPGEWGTGGWKSDPTVVGGEARMPVGDGSASFSAMVPRGSKPTYGAELNMPIGNGFDFGATARMTPEDEMMKRKMQMLLQLTKRF